MIITPDFIMLNNPKTGSTYARQVIKSVYDKRDSRLASILKKLSLKPSSVIELKHINLQFPERPKNQHGTFSQIPEKYLNRPIASIIRNPFDKFISAFEYNYWKKHPPNDQILKSSGIEEISNMSVSDFSKVQIEGVRTKYPSLADLKIGSQTIQFIYMYFENPSEIIKKLDEDYFMRGYYKKDLAAITFLNQADLTAELKDFLTTFNFSSQFLNEHANFGPVNKNDKRTSLEYYNWTIESLEYIKTYERYLIHMLKEFGFEFPIPKLDK